MRILNRILLIFLTGLLAGGSTSCGLVGVSNSTLNQATQSSTEPISATAVSPLFVPQTNTVIESANASSLAPSDGITFSGANGFTWLPSNQGVALTGQEDLLLLPGPQTETLAQSGATVMTQTITSPTPSLLIAADKAAVIAWVSGGATI